MNSPKARRKEQWKTLTRQAILEAVVRLISHLGISGMTMDRVAAEAGVSKGTIYLHFADKGHLLDAVKEFTLQPLTDSICALLEGDLPPLEKIEALVACHLGYFDAHREFFRIFLLERQVAQLHLKRQRSGRYQDYVDRLAQVIQEGSRTGALKPLAPAKVAAMLVEAEIAVCLRRLGTAPPDPVEEDARLLTEVFLRGITERPNPKGKPR